MELKSLQEKSGQKLTDLSWLGTIRGWGLFKSCSPTATEDLQANNLMSSDRVELWAWLILDCTFIDCSKMLQLNPAFYYVHQCFPQAKSFKMGRCGISHGYRIQTENAVRMFRWREIALVQTGWLQERRPHWGSANHQHTDTWADSQLCHRIKAHTASHCSLYYPQITCPHSGKNNDSWGSGARETLHMRARSQIIWARKVSPRLGRVRPWSINVEARPPGRYSTEADHKKIPALKDKVKQVEEKTSGRKRRWEYTVVV